MNHLKEAIRAFRDNDFTNALALFEKAGAIYGSKSVESNILLCKKALLSPPHTPPPSHESLVSNQASEPFQLKMLDPGSRYMLARKGDLTLTDLELQECLDEHKRATSRKSKAAAVKAVIPKPGNWPEDLVLAPLPKGTNDWRWRQARKQVGKAAGGTLQGLSVIIPTFNRSRILDVTLACLVNQETRYPFEVVVADDGSKEAIDLIVRQYESLLDIKYVRQKDYGFQVSAVRNLGMRTAKYDFLAFLDCDMAPHPKWVETYMNLLSQDDGVALIGPRKYVDTLPHDPSEFRKSKSLISQLPEVRTNNKVAGREKGGISVDWRIDHFLETDGLSLCDQPFRYFAAGNIAFARRWLDEAGWFDEDFAHWGGEDQEFGYRLFRHGCFLRVAWDAMAYHQEPPGKENETDRVKGREITEPIRYERVPYFYRKLQPLHLSRIFKNPLVSIYIPAYNCANTIVRCIDSALNQTVVDLEVCICNDGSTDNTLEVLTKHYGHNPRVRVITQANGGIGSASNKAVRMAKGYYIGQLDADDYLEPDAVELCLTEFLADHKLACVYTTYRNVEPDGSLIGSGYNWSIFSREKLTTSMIAHHFRMFSVRAWHMTEGFDESIENAVDYDMYLKLSEVGPFKHINKICYNRVLHGENTTVKKPEIQKVNHFKSINRSLWRQGLHSYMVSPTDSVDPASRKYVFKKC
jgi:chondroitin synthase